MYSTLAFYIGFIIGKLGFPAILFFLFLAIGWIAWDRLFREGPR